MSLSHFPLARANRVVMCEYILWGGGGGKGSIRSMFPEGQREADIVKSWETVTQPSWGSRLVSVGPIGVAGASRIYT